jgi:hypothetical protein
MPSFSVSLVFNRIALPLSAGRLVRLKSEVLVAQVLRPRRQPYPKLFPPDMPQGSTLTLTARMTKPAIRSKHLCWRFGVRRGPSEGSGTDWLLIPEEQPEPVISYFQRFFACRRPPPNFFGWRTSGEAQAVALAAHRGVWTPRAPPSCRPGPGWSGHLDNRDATAAP